MNLVICFFLFAAFALLWTWPSALCATQTNRTLHVKPAHALARNFYHESCPRAHEIIRSQIVKVIKQNPSEAAGLLRTMFHDCFVQGCDASILLMGPMLSEQFAAPNMRSLRPSTNLIIDHIKAQLEAACPDVVSCADTLVLSAAIAVQLVGGPHIPVLLGRRDSSSAASVQTVVANLPSPQFNIFGLKQKFRSHGLNSKDLVALSGAHTFGHAHCRIVGLQLTPRVSADLDIDFAANLSRICLPANNPANGAATVHLDFITHDRFNNNYYKNVLNKVALFHSDAALLEAPDTKDLVQRYAKNEEEFFEQFKVSMLKLSEIGVLTGKNGVIRKKCSVSN
ncbi:hypothetical protein KP509_02G005500 [Ceratopteris richardii]|uniref:Peroxidase n=1 Tax=Ceratopteris richardii TaxID=49495 RepID=A0A8T2V734_CERRI|nr:hypothetical protein KP509_02G005500 [Ceratopteris richardii]